jgi:hypothetical protein
MKSLPKAAEPKAHKKTAMRRFFYAAANQPNLHIHAGHHTTQFFL